MGLEPVVSARDQISEPRRLVWDADTAVVGAAAVVAAVVAFFGSFGAGCTCQPLRLARFLERLDAPLDRVPEPMEEVGALPQPVRGRINA